MAPKKKKRDKKPKKRKCPKKPKALPGISLEQTVARIQQLFDKESKVTHNEMLEDRVGNIRQYDVVIRGNFGGRPALGVIECKDHKRKKGPADIEAFAKKTENLGANFRLMVSRKGFTPQALKLAKHEFIGCLSLLPENPSQKLGFRVGVYAYAKVYQWTHIAMVVHHPTDEGKFTFKTENVLLEGKPILRWFEKQLDEKYGSVTAEGDFRIEVAFREPQPLFIGGKARTVYSISVTGTRKMFKKRRFLALHGDAFFDWATQKAHIPGGGQTLTQPFTLQFNEWDDFDGDIEKTMKEKPGLYTMCFTVSVGFGNETPDDLDLTPHILDAENSESALTAIKAAVDPASLPST